MSGQSGRTPTWCERCWDEHDIDRPGVYVREFGRVLCDDCTDSLSEAAYERSLRDYYGGSGPVTVNEHYQQAAAVKRGVR